jgi:UDP-N-acetylmuramoyl-L-alanyl-D-glutamate--2,6-diaminopimelate ligase
MQAYGEAKARLFAMPGLATAVLNLDDALGVRLAQRLTGSGVRTIGYSLSPAAIVPGSVDEHIAADSIAFEGASTRLELATSRGRASIVLAQIGRFNASNALGVLGCLLDYGLSLDAASALLASLPQVPGRMQRLGGGGRPLVVIDYAHTPDAIDKVLQALRPVADAADGRLAIVFGAGGDRDPAKRPLMGAIASKLADRIVLTTDNSRNEDPAAILEAIRKGVTAPVEIEQDRARAIEKAIGTAQPEDVILVAGRGHEGYQEAGGKRVEFSDAAVAQAALDLWRPA